jgi:hypothetical protein
MSQLEGKQPYADPRGPRVASEFVQARRGSIGTRSAPIARVPQLECLNLGRESDPALPDASGIRNFGYLESRLANATSRAARLAALQRCDTSAINQRARGKARATNVV